ncbi:hypothetical protein [Gottschalkia purinilytica]|nr:hypothetical protein [Gottschalkia purinilytica]
MSKIFEILAKSTIAITFIYAMLFLPDLMLFSLVIFILLLIIWYFNEI